MQKYIEQNPSENELRIIFADREFDNGYIQKDIEFSDGQQLIKLDSEQIIKDGNRPYIIASTMLGFKSLERIVQINQALRFLGVTRINLYVPYFLGSRSDRRFESGMASYIKEVIAPIINSQKFDRVFSIDLHSDVVEAAVDNLHIIKANDVFDMAKHINKDDFIVSPDAGATKKIFDIAKLAKNSNVVVASKLRNVQTGQIFKTIVPKFDYEFATSRNVHICDDICDGGRTFVELIKAIKEQHPKCNIILWVTHGIFSNDDHLEWLLNNCWIKTTNSCFDKLREGTWDVFSEKFIKEKVWKS